MLGLWCDGPGDAGYLIRCDGAVCAIGEFQSLTYDSYGVLSELPPEELALIWANLMCSSDYLSDLKTYPGHMQLSNPLALYTWASEAASNKKSKITP